MKVNIIGAGFAGLTIARELKKRGLAVEIFEKADRPGGLIGTYSTPSGLVETAAPSFTRTKAIEKLFEEIGVQILEPSKASKKRLFYVGHLKSWPLNVFETGLMAVKGILFKVTGLAKPKNGETVGHWGNRVLTEEAMERFIGAGLQGIYAGDIEKMSASLVLGPLFDRKREKFRGVLGVQGGSFKVIRALEEDLAKSGVKINFNAKVEDLPKPCVIATSAAAAARILAKENPQVSRRISAIRMVPLISVTAFYGEPTGPKAFGCLVPRHQGVRALGILLNHAIFPGQSQKFSETWIFGGATDAEIMNLSDQVLTELIGVERKKIFGKTDKPIEIQIVRWPEALPHYDLVLESILPELQSQDQVWLHGNWLGGIGLSKILDRSQKLAEKIARELL